MNRSAVLDLLLESAAPRARDSFLHGEGHWAHVAVLGAELASQTRGADPDVIFAFSLAHDGQRIDDGHDIDHGRRAAAWVRANGRRLGLDEASLVTLTHACALHVDGGLSADPTVAVCFDADRLCLWRVGIAPDPALLSTPAGRRRTSIELSRHRMRGRAPSWSAVLDLYDAVGWELAHCPAPPISAWNEREAPQK